MINCESDKEQLNELRRLGIKGLHNIIIRQQEQINELKKNVEELQKNVRIIFEIEAM